jgi:hypothetical protein
MALTGKTIGELEYLQFPTNDTLLPVEYIGETYHISFSSITYNEGTYSQFVTEANSGLLTPGRFYLMTDFQTCYDQPNFDSSGNPITTGNYKTGTTEPLLLLAVSTTGFSPTVYSTLYPSDKIKYDITWNTTEVTSSPAKGRITERIDDRNNRADYDFRSVQFIRYDAFLSEVYLDGTVSIDGSGNVVGIRTSFDTDFTVGDIVGIKSGFSNFIGGFSYYEIISITDSTNMVVSGNSYYNEFNVIYSRGTYGGQRSPFQCNITNPSYTGFSEYYTFNGNDNYNTYLGDNLNYDTFILSNNVFLNGTYINNTFGGNVIGNTFDDDMDNNNCAPSFQYNIITNDFDDNTVGPNFQRNFIECDMQGNSIVGNFLGNMIGDNDGYDFDYNVVGWNFRDNFITMYDNNFIDNIIGSDFSQNLIHYGFSRNTIGDNFNANILRNSFDENEIGPSFYSNTIRASFNNNKIGSLFNNNIFYSIVTNNIFGNNSYNNVMGDPNNVGVFSFQYNQVGSDLISNNFSGETSNNVIGTACQSNNTDTNFSYNRIGSNFTSNIIANDFGFGGSYTRGNIVGNGFSGNIVGEYCYDNTFGDNCTGNNFSDNFTNNKISYGFFNTTINDIDSSGSCQNNIFGFGNFSADLTLSGGTGGNPFLYTDVSCSVVRDADATIYVTFFSGGTSTSQTLIV